MGENTMDRSGNTPPPMDAKAIVTIAPDKLSAYIELEEAEKGGKPLSYADLKNALATEGVTFGILEETLSNLAKDPIYNREFLIAKGEPPVHGQNGSFTLLFDITKNYKPAQKEDGTVDFRNLSLINNVQQGQELCIITPPTQGVDGRSVQDKRLSATNGKAVPYMVGKNVRLNEDGTKIYALIDGHVDFAAGKIHVNDTLFIKENVDHHTGNINSVSNVVVLGTIAPGFTVESEGRVEVYGTVSNATIKSAGNVILRNGMIGGNVVCDGNLTARFLENCRAFVKGGIEADYIMNSDIKCAKNIIANGPIGKIVGGSLMAGGNVKARVVGSTSGIKTYIEIGTDPTIMERQQELTAQIPQLEVKINSLTSLIRLFEQLGAVGRLTPEKQQQLEDAKYSYETCVALLESSKEELETINQSVRKKGYGKVCGSTICPETTVKIGAFKSVVQVSLQNTCLFYTNDGIAEAYNVGV